MVCVGEDDGDIGGIDDYINFYDTGNPHTPTYWDFIKLNATATVIVRSGTIIVESNHIGLYLPFHLIVVADPDDLTYASDTLVIRPCPFPHPYSTY